jgi:hypothetical protein
MIIYGNGFANSPKNIGLWHSFMYFALYFVNLNPAGFNFYPNILLSQRRVSEGDRLTSVLRREETDLLAICLAGKPRQDPTPGKLI